MWGYVVIHPERWEYRPLPPQVTACVEFLQGQGVLGSLTPGTGDQYAVGPKCEELLGFEGDWATVTASPHIRIECGPLEASCPHCGAEISNWSDLFSRFCESGQEPEYLCTACQTRTPTTRLTYIPGAAFGYFMITFTESRALEAKTESPVWAEMERILGTRLIFTTYML